MKRLLPFSSILLVAGALLTGCQQDPSSTGSPSVRPLTVHGGTSSAAHPALTYEGSETYHGSTYRTLAVMDTDGTHQTNIYGGHSMSASFWYNWGSWSPTGGAICFYQSNLNTSAPQDTLKAIDVSVNSSGTAVGSNVRTIYAFPNGDGSTAGLAWSSTSTMNKIAFVSANANNKINTLYIISTTGGTPQKVCQIDGSTFVKENGSIVGHRMGLLYPTWSPDDHRLAVNRCDSSDVATGVTVANTIMIFNTTDNGSTWTYTDSIKTSSSAYPYNFSPFQSLDWSRSNGGIDQLAFANSGSNILYHCTPTTGSTPTSIGVSGYAPVWSPNNSSILYYNTTNGDVSKITPFGTSVTNVISSPAIASIRQIRWKR